jgi:hypothetical protein
VLARHLVQFPDDLFFDFHGYSPACSLINSLCGGDNQVSCYGSAHVLPAGRVQVSGSLQTRPGQKIIADRARQKILLPVPVLVGKNSGANVTGLEIFFPNRFCRDFFYQSNPMRSTSRVGWGRACGDWADPGPVSTGPVVDCRNLGH